MIESEKRQSDLIVKITEEERDAIADINEKTEEIKSMPAATIGVSVQEAWMMKGCFTLERVYETGKNLASVYTRAGETYEALGMLHVPKGLDIINGSRSLLHQDLGT